MKYLFMDEKGPQGSFKITQPFCKVNKLSYGSDDMHSYVANVIQLEKSDYESIQEKYKQIVSEYLSTREQLKNSLLTKNKELKGLDLLKTNFDCGIASMKSHEIQFYSSLFDLLNQYGVDNLLFMVSKMSVITSARFRNFYYFLDEKTTFSAFLVKYVLTKYAEVEASETVVKALLDTQMPIKEVLRLIEEDLDHIIASNMGNQRMHKQLSAYKQIKEAIKEAICQEEIEILEADPGIKFDWNQVAWAIDLWITEQNQDNPNISRTLFLDEGIPSSAFENLELSKVEENCNSKDHIGLQITDMIVVLIGKLVSKITNNTRYDFNAPQKRVILSKDYFDLDEKQFELILKINKFLLEGKTKYHFINDSYFDESVLLQAYIGYIASFNSLKEYKAVKPEKHAEGHFKKFTDISETKYIEGPWNENMAKEIFGSLRKGVESGMVRPL